VTKTGDQASQAIGFFPLPKRRHAPLAQMVRIQRENSSPGEENRGAQRVPELGTFCLGGVKKRFG
jgi:hypothetical protein